MPKDVSATSLSLKPGEYEVFVGFQHFQNAADKGQVRWRKNVHVGKKVQMIDLRILR